MLSLDTGSYQGTLIKRIPFVVDNPDRGRAAAELPATAELRARHAEATVVELFHDAPLSQWGIPAYDGVRDVYFGPQGGGCTSCGTIVSYGDDLRYQLHLGGSDRRVLISYDLSMLPSGTKAARAMLALHVVHADKRADLSCRVFAMKKPWSETFVGPTGGIAVPPYTRGRPYPVGEPVNWDKPLGTGGGDRHDQPVASLTFDKPGWVLIDVTAAVNHWLSGRRPNHGLMLETANRSIVAGRFDVRLRASDYNGEPAERPRLQLALEGEPKAVQYQVTEARTDLPAALALATDEKKLVLCNILSARSLTSRRLETHVLASAAMKAYIERNFVEVRIDGDKPRYEGLLKRYNVRRFPTVLVLAATGKGRTIAHEIIEPYDWDCDGGTPRSGFELEQVYSRLLGKVVNAWRARGKLRTGRRVPCN